jgi:pimeloyl-ACP methyl ester carboxylesterase
VLWGADDAWLSPETGERLASLMPGAALSVIDGAGHLVHHDAPVALADEIRAWLGAVRDRGD